VGLFCPWATQAIRALRMRHAMRELARTAKPIADIALEAGFSDQSHLTRAFKNTWV